MHAFLFTCFLSILVLSGLGGCVSSRPLSPEAQERLATRYPQKYVAALTPEAQRQSLNLAEGRVSRVDEFGRSVATDEASHFDQNMSGGDKVFVVHGTMYDTAGNGLYQPHLTLNAYVRMQLEDQFSVVGVGWRSVPFSFGNLTRAWRRGHWTWYGLARERAQNNAAALAEVFQAMDEPFSVVCHSLGCHMSYLALAQQSSKVQAVVMLSPDVHIDAVKKWSENEEVPVLHVSAQHDGTARWSAFRTANADADLLAESPCYRYLEIDADAEFDGHRRTSADYANPRRYWDHMVPIEAVNFWPQYRRFLAGDHSTN